MKKDICGIGLYAILDRGYISASKFVDVAQKMIDAGCILIQIRDKTSSPREVLKIALEVRKVFPPEAFLIINDFVEVAREIDADGVHLGQEDLSVKEARKILGPRKIIGRSTHSYEQALAASKEAVDYIAYGPIYQTKTKPMAVPVGTSRLKDIKEKVHIPVFAIGGICEENVEEVLKAGADGVAVVSAILESSDIERMTRGLLNKIKQFKQRRTLNHEIQTKV